MTTTDGRQPDEARSALREIDSRQREVVDASLLPTWFWGALGILMVVLTGGVESRRPGLVIGASIGFTIGMVALIVLVIRRQRVQIRGSYIGVSGGLAIAGFVVVAVVPALVVGLLLARSGYRWPATAGNATAAIVLIVGGPVLMRRLRHIMNGRTAGSAR